VVSTLTPCADTRIGENIGVSVTRIAWLVTVLVSLLTAVLLLLSGYKGYAGLGLAVAISAAINLL
jgi:ABC-type Fe3+-siderophore transport system permease subunit